MKEIDKEDYINRYEGRLKEFGYDSQTLGWGKISKQDVRFSILASEALKDKKSSVLDIGCGFADLYDYLIIRGWEGKYTGIDIVPGLINMAKKRHPHLDLKVCDINSENSGVNSHDYVIASGIMNAQLASGENEEHIKTMLQSMFRLTNNLLAVDFLSTKVDFRKQGAWHTAPEWAISNGLDLTNRVLLRHDYMRYEFALFLYKAQKFSGRNVFDAYEEELKNRTPQLDH
jgi:SAM-dependent methyltransferase